MLATKLPDYSYGGSNDSNNRQSMADQINCVLFEPRCHYVLKP